MDRRQSLIANPQPAKLVQPGDGPLHDPACLAQLTAMRGSTLANLVSDPPVLQGLPMGSTVMGAIHLYTLPLAKWSSALASNGADAIDQRQQLGDAVPIGFDQNYLDRDSLRVDEEVVLAVPAKAHHQPVRGSYRLQQGIA